MVEHDSRHRSTRTAAESIDRSNRSVDDTLDELLVALRSDQGGARTDALKRALEQERESDHSDEVLERIGTLESAVGKLLHVVETDSRDDGPALEDVRSALESTIEDLRTLQADVDSLESTDAALEERLATLEARLDNLESQRDGPAARTEELAARIADLEARLEGEARTATLEAQIANDARAGDLEARLDDLETTVAEVADRLTSVEVASRGDPSDRAARDALAVDDVAGGEGDAQSESEADRDAAPIAKRVEHVERKLDTRTTALASRLRNIEGMAAQIDSLEARLDERTAALETELEDVSTTMEEGITLLHEGTQSELSAVRSELEDLAELRSSIDALAADVDALEAHAADMTLWRNSIEGPPEPDGTADGDSDADVEDDRT